MQENEVAKVILDAAFTVHNALGPGMLENVYEAALAYELRSRGMTVETQVPQPAIYKGIHLGIGYRLDMVVESCVVVELKAVEHLLDVHHKQLITYLQLSGYKLGLLLNFDCALLRDGIFRKVNGL